MKNDPANMTLFTASAGKFLVLLLACVSVYGQEKPDWVDPYEKTENVTIGPIPVRMFLMHLDGSLETAPYSVYGVKYPARETIELLRNSNIREEMEVVGKQEDEIDSLLDKTKKLEEHAVQDYFATGKLSEEVCAKLMTLDEDINAIFVPSQMERLEELKFRCLLRREGFLGAFLLTPFSKELNLSQAQRNRLRNECKEIAGEFAPQALELGKEASKKLMECLDDEQMKTLTKLFGEDFFKGSLPLDVFLFQICDQAIENDSVATPDATTVHKTLSGYEGILVNPFFQIAVDGSIVQEESEMKIGLELMDLLMEPEISQSLDLSDDQLADIQSKHEDLGARIREFTPSASLLQDRDKLNEFMEQTKGKSRAIHASVPDEIENILLPHQVKRFKELCSLIGIRRQGVFQSLIDGELNEKLKVSAKQKERLKSKASEIRKEMKDKTIKIEEELTSRVLTNLDETQRKLVESRMGKRIHKMPANVETSIVLLGQSSF